MNSQIGRSRLAAVALYIVVLAGCNAVQTVDQQPTIPAPAQTAVLQGEITGLGTRRPVILQYNGQDGCVDPTITTVNPPKIPCRFFGTQGQDTSAFSFGSFPLGTPYDITVATQPYGKICTVVSGSGTLGTTPVSIAVTCANDPSIQRHTVSGTISAAASSIPGLKVILTTEDGVQQVDGTGQSTFSFPDAIFDSGTHPPVFVYRVTAVYTPDGSLTSNNCAVSNGTNPLSGSGADAGPVSPAADVTNVQITACTFPVNVSTGYRSGGTGVTLPVPTPSLGSGLMVALRDPASGLLFPQNLDSTTTSQVLSYTAFGSQSFTGVLSNANAMYDLVITQQPAGQTCVVGSASSTAQLTAASAVLLINPADTANGFLPAASASNPAAGISKNIRCQNNPVAANQLRGTYQLTTITSVTTDNPVGTTITTTPTRNFLTFFENGTFLYGVHGTGAATGPTSGVEHGFYIYDPVGGSIVVTPLTDTVTGSNSTKLSSSGGNKSLTMVVKSSASPNQITARFSGPTVTTATTNGVTTNTTTTIDWQLDEPTSLDGQMTGTWATDDDRRVWVYDGNTYAGFHVGVNGLANAEDACFPIDPPTLQSGFFSRRGNATTCQLLGTPSDSNIYTLDVPNANVSATTQTTPALPPGYVGKWPQSGTSIDGRPYAAVLFTIDPGTPDTLTVQDTQLNGAPINPPIVLHRTRAN